jgi:hypothetical protein
MGKPLQQDENGNIMNDAVTKENQKGYANYEADLKKRQEEMTGKDAKTKNRMESLMEAGMGLLGRPVKAPEGKKKGGSVRSSASKRADGIATKGKTRGKYI